MDSRPAFFLVMLLAAFKNDLPLNDARLSGVACYCQNRLAALFYASALLWWNHQLFSEVIVFFLSLSGCMRWPFSKFMRQTIAGKSGWFLCVLDVVEGVEHLGFCLF